MKRFNPETLSLPRWRCALVLILLFFLFGGALATSSRADSIASLTQLPVSSSYPVFTFGGSPTQGLSTGSGAVGNGDGGLPIGLQTPGGLALQTPFDIVVGTSFGQQNNPDGSTTFYDTTMTLTGFGADGFAQQFGSLDVQELYTGDFSIYGSKSGGGEGPLLLSGILSNSAITGADGSNSAAVLTGTATYTGGVIFNALINAGGSATDSSSFNLSLSGSSQVGINGSPGSAYLKSFTANGQAFFNATGYTIVAVPEPSSILIMGLGFFTLGLAARRKRRFQA